MQTYDVLFRAGRDGRPIARHRGMKIMMPIAGLKPVDGREYRVRIIRDTRPGERGGALLVEVLEDLTAAYLDQVKAWREEQKAAEEAARKENIREIRAHLLSLGLNVPSEEELDQLLPQGYHSWASETVREILLSCNTAPEIPGDIIEVARKYRENRPIFKPYPPTGWDRPEENVLIWKGTYCPEMREYAPAVAIKATLNMTTGDKFLDLTPGRMCRESYRAGLSPDEMREVYCSVLVFEYLPREVSEEERAQAAATVPWPSEEEITEFLRAEKNYYAAVEAVRAEKDRLGQVLIDWAKSLSPGERTLLGIVDSPGIIAERVLQN